MICNLGFPRFQRKLLRTGIDLQEIRYVLLTHAHDDHAGFLNDVLRNTDAKVILHPLAVEGLRRGQNSFDGGCAGIAAYVFCRLTALLGKGAHCFPPVAPEYLDRLIPVGSEAFRALHFPYRILETPGHTADHIAMLAGGRLFCGDAAMNVFPSVRHTVVWIENREQYAQSWRRILRAHPVWLMPAHGKPFAADELKKCFAHLERVKLYPLKKPEGGNPL